MQKQLSRKLNWKSLLPAAVAGVLLGAPLAGVTGTAQAKPGNGRALGHQKQPNWKHSYRRSSRSQWNNGVHRRTRTRSSWDRRDRDWNRDRDWDRDNDRDSRRYRLRYRTRYNSNGVPYRQWFRSYF